MLSFTILLLSMFTTITLIPILKRAAFRLHVVDVPNERKVHAAPIPKVGGIAMAAGTLIPLVIWAAGNEFAVGMLAGAFVIALFGMVDDVRDLGYRWKFFGQVLAALTVIGIGGLQVVQLGECLPEGVCLPIYVSVPLTLLVIVGVTNAVNLADGLDGLAGGIMLLSFVCMAFVAFLTGQGFVLMAAAAVIGAIFGFLRFNTHPAVVFMGDTGSQLIGFLAICLSLQLTQGESPVSRLFPLLLLGFPVLDTLTVMTERIAEGRSPFKPDKNHFHHKLMKLGLYHTEAVFAIYLIQAVLVTSAFFLRFYSEWVILSVYAVFSGGVIAAFQAARATGWQLKRYDLIDNVLKGRLRVLKEKNLLIVIAFRTLSWGLPALMVFSCLIYEQAPGYIARLAAGLFCANLLARFVRPDWLGGIIRISCYLIIPFVIFLSQEQAHSHFSEKVLFFYDLSFILVAFATLLTLKYTRRQRGFKPSPFDFIILFLAVVVPNLPDPLIQRYALGQFTTKMITIMFALEVMIGELRGHYRWLFATTLVFLGVIGVRGAL